MGIQVIGKRKDSYRIQTHLSWTVFKTQPSHPFNAEMKVSNGSLAVGTVLQILTDYFGFSAV